MRPGNIARLSLIAGSLVLLVLLMFANTTPPAAKPEAVEAQAQAPRQLPAEVAAATSALGSAQRSLVESWEKEAAKGTAAGISAFDSLMNFWNGSKRQDIAAFYAEKIALAKNSKQAWNEAGRRYYVAVNFAKAESRPELYNNAAHCFEKALSLDPDDLDIKTSLAACYVEGSSDPMKGITMLREVIEADSNHVNAIWQLGMFSMKSGQFDKAVARFKKITEIAPSNLDVYLYLAEAYEQSGDRENAIAALEKYVSLVDDAVLRTEVQSYINELRNSLRNTNSN